MLLLCLTSVYSAVSGLIFARQSSFGPHILHKHIKYQGNRYINDGAALRKVQLCLRATIPLSVKRDDLNLRGAPVTFTTAQPRFQSFFGGRFFSQNWHFGITKRITKHNFLVLQSTYLYFVSNEDHTFEKKNVSFLLVTSTFTVAYII